LTDYFPLYQSKCKSIAKFYKSRFVDSVLTASMGLLAGKTFFKKSGVSIQVKGEWIGKMKADKNVDMVAFYNICMESTGGRNVLFVPQISYSYKSFSVYVLSEIPLCQYLNGNQICSQYQFTAGLSYRFLTYKPITDSSK
jgi:hypothetical protein